MGTDSIVKPKKKIAVFANAWSAEYLGMVIDGLQKEAAKDCADIFVYTTFVLPNESEEMRVNQLKIYDLPNPNDFDGAIILAHTFNTSTELDKVCSLVKNFKIPTVTTEIKIPGLPMVGTDNYRGIYDLTNHLIEEHGVRKVVFVEGNEGNTECAERRRALEDALEEHGLVLMDTVRGDFGFYMASYNIEEYIKKNKPIPDAFVCANDLMALGVISKLHQYGKRVPEDVIVTGFDHVHESRTSYPLVATVSRQWDNMGKFLYDELNNQIVNPDPSKEIIYPSEFIPSESCGCKPEQEAYDARLERVRNIYTESTETDMVDFFFQRVHIEMSSIGSKEEFPERAKWQWGHEEFFGKDYCIITEPEFFELEDEEYFEKVTKFSDRMDIIYERRDGKSLELRQYDIHGFYPGYKEEPDKSNIFVFSALANLKHLIGYVAIKNNPRILYTLQFKRWVNNLDTLFLNVRHNIFLKRINEKLRQIYMTDFLTDMYNRTGCETVLYKFIEEKKKAGQQTVLLFYDINCMKVINDKYGHLNGDLAIKATANAMRDSLPSNFLLGRYGGDEFIAVGCWDGSRNVDEYRKSFGKALKKIMDGLKVSFRLSASVGDCLIGPDKEGTIDDYIREADESMYEEKERAHKELGIS
ncbi:MAG: diguanylate cyclase [Lachnospiraceae bacterium]|nr:diguanylate cyclase [Lachnospiraceae bacterium]